VLLFRSFEEGDVQDTAKSARIFRFGVFEVDAASGELRKQGMRIRLQEQPSQLLLMLLDRAGEVVKREEICRKLWASDTFVDFDQSLGTALRKLRQALDDDAETPRYIETIPKQGFRFVAPVERIPPLAEGVVRAREPSLPEAKPETRAVLPVWWAALLAAACVLSFFLGWLVRLRPDVPGRSAELPGARVVRSAVVPPPNWSFEHSSFSISPDGTRLAFVAVGPQGNDKLWIRRRMRSRSMAPMAHCYHFGRPITDALVSSP
jgi:DNA-binding winged helix-turn-helix (wHTH) protein